MLTSGQLSRRAFVGGLAAAGLGVPLAACGSSASSASTSAGTGKPKRGGRLRVAMTGGGSSDTLDAHSTVNFLDAARVAQLYDPLAALDYNATIQLALASEITPNSTATEWTVRLRPGVTFHNGKPLTADDVIFTFQRILNPKDPKSGAAQLAALDYKNIKKLDSLTLRLPFHTPYSAFVQVISDGYYYIVPVGYDAKHPVGTGAFKFESFTPGQQSIFVRNDNYWRSGLPYLDSVVITDYADETSQVNALESKQVDAIDALSAASVSGLRSQGQNVIASASGSWEPFTMRVDVAPFSDVRVRQALRLVVNRKEMLDEVFGGYGAIGNDLYAKYDPDYNDSLPQREQDLEQAKALVKQAGHPNLTVELVTAPIGAGAVDAAQLLKQQAAGAGITINLRQVPAGTLYGPNYLKWAFSQDTAPAVYYLGMTGQLQVPGAPFNEDHYANPRFDDLYAEALATTNPTKQREIVHEMQVIQWNEGGYIIPFFIPNIDAYGPNVRGAVPSKNQYLSNFEFRLIWLA